MKAIARFFLAIYTAMYRLTNGIVGGKMGPNKVLLLNSTGRKSGKPRTTPLGFFDWHGGYIIVASNGGNIHNPGWYYNLKNHPQATVQVNERVIPVQAEILTGDQRA